MSKQHKDIVNDQLHDPKDFEDAVENSVLSKSDLGLLEWVPKSEVGGQGPAGDPGTTLKSIEVVDINNPVELNTEAGIAGDSIICYQVISTGNKSSKYIAETNALPAFPPFLVVGAGGIEWRLDSASWIAELVQIANGYIKEAIDVVVGSDGVNVTLTLQRKGGGDLTIIEDGHENPLDATPALSVQLTPGSDTSPTLNYIFIENGILTASTSDFPASKHQPIATSIVQSATSAQSDGVYKLHVWENNYIDENDMGELSHITKWIRQQNATWISGVLATPSVGVNIFDLLTSAGLVSQVHEHAMPAFNTSVSDFTLVPNDNTVPFRRVTDLTTILIDSLGVSMSNLRFNLVVWGVISENDSDCNLMINLPNSSYNNDADAINDINATSSFTIPNNFKNSGFLIARLTVRHISSSSTWSILQNEDLRGTFPSTAAGAGPSGLITEFADNIFKLFDEGDVTKLLQFQLANLTTANTRIMTVPDKDFTPADVIENETFQKNVQVNGQGYSSTNTLVDASTIATDCDTGNVHTVTLGGNRTLLNPTNLKNGATYTWIIKQDATGGRTLAYGSAFKFEDGLLPILSTPANSVDILSAVSDGTNVYAQIIKDFK